MINQVVVRGALFLRTIPDDIVHEVLSFCQLDIVDYIIENNVFSRRNSDISLRNNKLFLRKISSVFNFSFNDIALRWENILRTYNERRQQLISQGQVIYLYLFGLPFTIPPSPPLPPTAAHPSPPQIFPYFMPILDSDFLRTMPMNTGWCPPDFRIGPEGIARLRPLELSIILEHCIDRRMHSLIEELTPVALSMNINLARHVLLSFQRGDETTALRLLSAPTSRLLFEQEYFESDNGAMISMLKSLIEQSRVESVIALLRLQPVLLGFISNRHQILSTFLQEITRDKIDVLIQIAESIDPPYRAEVKYSFALDLFTQQTTLFLGNVRYILEHFDIPDDKYKLFFSFAAPQTADAMLRHPRGASLQLIDLQNWILNNDEPSDEAIERMREWLHLYPRLATPNLTSWISAWHNMASLATPAAIAFTLDHPHLMPPATPSQATGEAICLKTLLIKFVSHFKQEHGKLLFHRLLTRLFEICSPNDPDFVLECRHLAVCPEQNSFVLTTIQQQLQPQIASYQVAPDLERALSPPPPPSLSERRFAIKSLTPYSLCCTLLVLVAIGLIVAGTITTLNHSLPAAASYSLLGGGLALPFVFPIIKRLGHCYRNSSSA